MIQSQLVLGLFVIFFIISSNIFSNCSGANTFCFEIVTLYFTKVSLNNTVIIVRRSPIILVVILTSVCAGKSKTRNNRIGERLSHHRKEYLLIASLWSISSFLSS